MSIRRGITADGRDRLRLLTRNAKGPINRDLAAKVWSVPTAQATRWLIDLANAGWLLRVKRGSYLAVPADISASDMTAEDPWILGSALFAPAYIGGWSALEHWELTEQVFASTMVFTSKRVRKTSTELGGARFQIRTIDQGKFFGLKSVWRGSTRVQVSDPTRTMIDLFNDPSIGGGIRPTTEALQIYLRRNDSDLKLLTRYAADMSNGAIFKRLGFVAESLGIADSRFIEECQAHLSKGFSKLDPTLESKNLSTKWRLWYPDSWKNEERVRDR